MNPSAVRLAKAYEPMIKFVGTRHPVLKHDKVLPHPCTVEGLMPGSAQATPVADFLKNYKPFQIFPYKNPNASSAVGSGSKYQYTERPLKENEVASTAELPARFQYKPIDEAELESINSGGAY
ncbi:Alpha-ketoglutarate dehydrogenase subunit 4, mitochondrial [Nakaseomyces bracarensis]|uniref:Alpha-ketoglutarate dehydrogenase subunit 4, mitochondrial n=1 Tax=Nakaseomyces bracarensis TaxID=273131 RepID=A0ABR4NN97_9SACH